MARDHRSSCDPETDVSLVTFFPQTPTIGGTEGLVVSKTPTQPTQLMPESSVVTLARQTTIENTRVLLYRMGHAHEEERCSEGLSGVESKKHLDCSAS